MRALRLGPVHTVALEYSADYGATWNTFYDGVNGTAVTLANAGDIICIRAGQGGNPTLSEGYDNRACYFYFSKKVRVGGNIMSLLTQDDVSEFPAGTESHAFDGLFYNCDKLIDALALKLPATTLVDSCYRGMFYGCTSLLATPAVLPATTLAENCYADMFGNCAALVYTADLPATTLAAGCYSGMFQNCASLKNASALPAPALAPSCYAGMYSGCASLINASSLPATTLAGGCYSNMF